MGWFRYPVTCAGWRGSLAPGVHELIAALASQRPEEPYMSGKSGKRPRFELARVWDEGATEVSCIELRQIGKTVGDGTQLTMARRGFIGLSALSAGALLASCSVVTASRPTKPPQATATATHPALITGRVPSSGAQLYTAPYSGAPVITSLKPDTTFQVVARDYTTVWLEIMVVDGTAGWVLSTSVEFDVEFSIEFSIESLPISHDVEPTPSPTPAPPVATVPPGGDLPVYDGPDFSFSVRFVLSGGVQVKLTGRDQALDWVDIVAPDGRTGWAYTLNLDIAVGFDVGSLPVPANIPTPPNNGGSGGGGGICTCDQICTCILVMIP
jgi:hypothetical protein